MRCTKCGTIIYNGERFCSGCGAPVAGQARPGKRGGSTKKGFAAVLVMLLLGFSCIGYGGAMLVRNGMPQLFGGDNETTEVAETEENNKTAEDAEAAAEAETEGGSRTDSSGSYKIGETYMTRDKINVRRYASESADYVKAIEIEANLAYNLDSYNAEIDGRATVDSGTEVTVHDIDETKDANGNVSHIWLETEYGWMCAKKGSDVYIR